MTGRGKPGAVVVGVDEAGSAEDAVDWAAAEAAARDCPLRVVHAFCPPLPAGVYGFASPLDGFLTARVAARLILAEAVTRARSVAPGVEMSAHLAVGSATRVLVGEAGNARLLVLGGHSRSGLHVLRFGSVGGTLTRRSPCPVVVIHPVGVRSADRHPRRSAPRVVVGVGPSSDAAIGFAFHAAHQRDIPLVALLAWAPDTAADFETVPDAPALSETAAGRALEQALARWREEFPTVYVVAELVRTDPASCLVAEASGAALLVVGSSSRGYLRGLLCGSIRRSVLRNADCPVAVVGRNGTATAPTGAEPRAVPRSRSTDRPRRQMFWIRRAAR